MDILQVVFTNQFLVRPTSGQTGEKEQNNKKDTRINATDSATSTVTTNNETAQQQQSQQQQQQQPQQSTPEFTFAETVLQKVGKPLKDVIEQVCQLVN